MELTSESLRVLGCLIEKAATTPDAYPLSSNALLAACNQSSNREPVVRYDERTVDAAMLELRDAGLARTVRGAGHRVFKHRHVADEALGLDEGAIAVMAVLMLRGSQTPGEVNTRVGRYGAGLDLAGVEATLDRLAERGLAERVPRRAGEREDRWVHRLGTDGAEPTAPPVTTASTSRAAPAPQPPRSEAIPTGGLEVRLAAVEAEVDALRAELDALVRRLGG